MHIFFINSKVENEMEKEVYNREKYKTCKMKIYISIALIVFCILFSLVYTYGIFFYSEHYYNKLQYIAIAIPYIFISLTIFASFYLIGKLRKDSTYYQDQAWSAKRAREFYMREYVRRMENE